MMGKMGAALSSVISYAMAGGLFLIYYMRTYHVAVREVFLFSPEELGRMKALLSRAAHKLTGRAGAK